MTDNDLIRQAIDLVHITADQAHESVVIFGASFNPVTLGHLDLIRVLLHDPLLKSQRIYLIPARQSPLKSAQLYASATDRVNMLALALEQHIEPVERARLSIQSIEIDRPGPSRMSVTLALLTLQHKARQRYTLVCGYDHLACFNQWYQWAAFKDLGALMFYPREGISVLDTASLSTLSELLQAGIKVTIVCVDKAQMAVGEAYCQQNMSDNLQYVQWMYNPQAKIMPSSATDIRAYYQQREVYAEVDSPEGITPEVHHYILQHGCYR